jgi:apolipoprotein D and lipocalin family protein
MNEHNPISSETVRDLDLKRYMGEWYEIAHFTFKYQKDCEKARAVYKWDAINQKILVENQCYSGDRMIRSRTAEAWIPDNNDKGKIKIMFNGFPRDPYPGDYWVHWTDYENAIVGGPSGYTLWWLSRKPTVKASEVEPMLNIIRRFGYDTDKLVSHPSIVRRG